MKLKVGQSETFEIDGMSVEIRRVDVRRYDWDHRPPKEGQPFGHPMEQAHVEIWIDGEKVGWSTRPMGFGKQPFSIYRLGPDSYNAAIGHVTVFGSRDYNKAEWLLTSEDIAKKAAELRRAADRFGHRLMTEPEIAETIRVHEEGERAKEAEREADRVRWANEREEKRQRAEEARNEVVMGLESIRDRHDALSLSNLEMVALDAAIKDFKGRRIT